MPTAADFRMEMYRMMNEAMHEGWGTVEINAGELHRRVGGYPGPNHRMPACCGVMRGAFSPDAGDVILEEPLSGMGATLTIRFVLPLPAAATAV
jgi:5-methylcytosine-specific restriction protein A